jgi:hypothetical protein
MESAYHIINIIEKMVESLSATFPFHKLRYYIYVTLEVLMFVDHPKAYEFMFTVNKATRNFLLDNFIAVRNGFTNEGLITHHIDLRHYSGILNFKEPFYQYDVLEKLYYKALERLICNRKITISLEFS